MSTTASPALRQVGIYLAVTYALTLALAIAWPNIGLTPLLRGTRAALVTGAAHAAFHLPAFLLTSVYGSAGARIIVVPMAMVTLTFAGVVYAWFRLASGIWPVALAHSSFNTALSVGASISVASSPAAMAYVTTETGVVTMLLTVATAAWLMRFRSAVLDRTPQPALG